MIFRGFHKHSSLSCNFLLNLWELLVVFEVSPFGYLYGVMSKRWISWVFEVEDVRSGLVSYCQQISEPFGQQHCIFASLSLQKSISGDGGAQIDVLDALGGYLLCIIEKSLGLKVLLDSYNGALTLRSLGENFVCRLFDYFVVGYVLDVEISESASSVDVECVFLLGFLLHLLWIFFWVDIIRINYKDKLLFMLIIWDIFMNASINTIF